MAPQPLGPLFSPLPYRPHGINPLVWWAVEGRARREAGVILKGQQEGPLWCGTVQYLDCDGGYKKLHRWYNCIELNIHKHTHTTHTQ